MRYYWADKDSQKAKEEELNSPEAQPQIILLGGGGPPDSRSVESHDNVIMFYGEVNEENAKSLNKALRQMDKDLQVVKVKYGVQVPIKLYINSFGGSIFAGFSTVDTIKSLGTPVHSYIDGAAASAATLISVVADKRFIHRNSFMLIHQLSSMMWGKYEEFKDEMENLDLLMTRIKEIYKEHCSIPKKELEEILKHDLWLDSAKCVKWSLVDEIV
jgi:ATP-dependent Clp protease protease subunit